MGQKTHPIGFRLGIIKSWNSKWYEEKNYAKWLHEDLKLRKHVRENYAHAGIAGIEIERAANKAKVVNATCELVHSLDSESAARRLTVPALIEINLAGEGTSIRAPQRENRRQTCARQHALAIRFDVFQK